jgi:hypothetical protein
MFYSISVKGKKVTWSKRFNTEKSYSFGTSICHFHFQWFEANALFYNSIKIQCFGSRSRKVNGEKSGNPTPPPPPPRPFP